MNNKNKNVVIIGAGPQGLTTGMILAHRGFGVKIFEKDSIVGGKSKSIKLGEFIFDSGSTFLMMKYVLDEIFYLTRRKSSDYLTFIKLDPMYRLLFKDKQINVTLDHKKMIEEIEKNFPGNSENFRKYLKDEVKKLKFLTPCLEKPYSSFLDMFKNPFLKAVLYLELQRTVYQSLSKYFKDEYLKLCFTFQSKYLGMFTWECPDAFLMIAYIEHEFGIYHVIGGLNKISEAMLKVAIEDGAKVYFNKKVKKILNNDKKIIGIELDDGEKIEADHVIVNADFSYTVLNLIDLRYVKKYSKEKLSKKKYSCSAFMLYFGLDKLYNFTAS